MNWGKARKLPVEVEYREVNPVTFGGAEYIKTREGTIVGYVGQDYIIKGVEGELYPIKKDIFHKTYEITQDCADLRREQE